MSKLTPPQFQGLQSVSPFEGRGFNIESPFGGRGFQVQSPFQGRGFNVGQPFQSPLARLQGFNPYAPKAPPPSSGKPGTGTPGGMDFEGPATASDNTTLNAGTIDAYIARTRPGSPLAGMGGFILQEANRQGVSVPLLLGIMLLESQLGSDGSYLPSVYNYGGLTGTGWEGQTGNTTGMARAFATFSSKEAGVKALIANLASGLYRGKNIRQQVGTWYLGNPDAGLGEADEQGNATVQQYLNTIGSVYQSLGINWNPEAAPTARPGAGGGTSPGLPGTLSSIWGGIDAPVTQDFGHTPYSAENPYNYGDDFGVGSGHHGLDIGVARGTRLFSPAAGTVIIAGGSGYFRDDSGQAGELRIRLDNGDEVILGHVSAINVRVGQRVTAGMFVGLSGTANGDHLHLEWRERANTSSGWRAVDPRTKMRLR